jgi:hypothetical protein
MLKYGLADETELSFANSDAYEQLSARIRRVIDSLLPRSSTVAVISKGDDERLCPSIGPRLP